MKIFLSPQVNDERINYHFEDNKIIATYRDKKDIFDFSDVPNGRLQLFDEKNGDSLIETILPVVPILSAEKVDGVLWIKLINWIPEKASKEELFPTWIDANDYVPIKGG